MQQSPTKLTAHQLCEESVDYAIDKYLGISEDKNEMTQKFDGDKIKLVQFLREREFTKKNDVILEKSINEEKKKVAKQREPKPLFKVIPGTKVIVPAETKITQTKTNIKPGSQSELF